MKSLIVKALFVLSAALIFGCAHKHYLGFHGPSVKAHPEVHAGVVQDSDCLNCHHPDRDPSGPADLSSEFQGMPEMP